MIKALAIAVFSLAALGGALAVADDACCLRKVVDCGCTAASASDDDTSVCLGFVTPANPLSLDCTARLVNTCDDLLTQNQRWKLFGARFRQLRNGGGGDIYAGVRDLGVGGNRVESNGVTWANGTFQLRFEYDAAAGRTLSRVVAPSGAATSVTFPASDSTIAEALAARPCGGTECPAETCARCTADRANTLEIFLRNDQLAAGLSLTNIVVNGNPQPSILSPTAVYLPGAWGSSFTVTATLNIANQTALSNSAEANRVEFLVGCNLDRTSAPLCL